MDPLDHSSGLCEDETAIHHTAWIQPSFLVPEAENITAAHHARDSPSQPDPDFSFQPHDGQHVMGQVADTGRAQDSSLPFIPAPSLPTMFENAAVCEKSSASPASPSMAAAGGGRRRKSSSASSGQPLDPRERNRIAAHKCRRKQKDNVARLQQKERELAQQHDLLATHVGQLREEILLLKNEILAHANCDCDSIQNYISQAARKLM